MVSVADLRQALQAGLWEALVDDDDRAAMRATSRDARDMADELHDAAVLPVGPGTWGSAAAIAAYHRKLGAVQSLHVRYSCDQADDARAAQFLQAYSAALGASLPANSCTITMTSEMHLSSSFTAVLLARVVPRVERLDIALGSYLNLAQLLTLMGPCTHLRSLRLLPADDDTFEPGAGSVWLDTVHVEGDVLEALCRLTRLHTLSGPWYIPWGSALQRLCAALPDITTLGLAVLHLGGASGACVSRQLHTLADWRHSAFHAQHSSHSWYLLDNMACRITGVQHLHSSLPALQQLDSFVIDATREPNAEVALAAAAAVAQRLAACAERWAFRVPLKRDDWLGAAQGLAQGSLAPMQHIVVNLDEMEAPRAAIFLRCLIAAAPNITMLALRFARKGHSTEALGDILKPLCRATRMHTLHLAGVTGWSIPADGNALWLADVVRGLARPNAEGGCCSALRRVLLPSAEPDVADACVRALADDGIDVLVYDCPW